jgi:hypothetical protein
MKANTYYLYENGKRLHFSYSLEKLIRFTVDTHSAEIYFNGVLVWVQRPENYI